MAWSTGEVIGLASYLHWKNIYAAEPTRTQDWYGIITYMAPVLIFKTVGWISGKLSCTEPLRW